jgi:hypothetical protein
VTALIRKQSNATLSTKVAARIGTRYRITGALVSLGYWPLIERNLLAH